MKRKDGKKAKTILRFLDHFRPGISNFENEKTQTKKPGCLYFLDHYKKGVDLEETKERNKRYPYFYQPVGGHMPFPDADMCPRFDSAFKDGHGIAWIDLVMCEKCHNLKTCKRHAEYFANSNKEYHDEIARLSEIRRERRGL